MVGAGYRVSVGVFQRWLRRSAGALVRPFGLAVESIDDLDRRELERDRLAAVLAHERAKVGKLKQGLENGDKRLAALTGEVRDLGRDIAELSAELDRTRGSRDAARREAWNLIKELERHGLAAGQTAPPASDDAARALVQSRDRAAFLDLAMARRPDSLDLIRDGVLSRSWPALDPPRGLGQAWAPLRIATVGEWRSPSCDPAHPRFLERQLGDPLVAEPDVLVFPKCEAMDFQERAHLVPEAIWRRARDGKTTVVLDSSNEGVPWWSGHSQAMHDFLAGRGVDPALAVHMTQDRQYRSVYEAWCVREGLTPMRIVTFDAFVSRSLQTYLGPGRQHFQQRLAAFESRPPQRTRRFLSLNNAPRPCKMVFLLRLVRDGLWDRGWVSFGGFSGEGGVAKLSKANVVDRLARLNGFHDEVDSLLPFVDQLDSMGPVRFGLGNPDEAPPRRLQALDADDLPQYADSWFTVVTETEMSRRVHRITEKPLKPLLNLHPFLVLGSPGSLALLRGYGFETFSDIFDERYDEELDPRRRFDMVYDQVVRLCAMDETELARMTAKVSEILAFNACWGLTELPRRFSETVAAGLIDQLAPRRPPA